jgi:cytoskeletal protein CcmA (bactofilin family)
MENNPNENQDDGLKDSGATLEATDSGSLSSPGTTESTGAPTPDTPPTPPTKPPFPKRIKDRLRRVNIFVLAFGAVAIVGICIVAVAYLMNGKTTTTASTTLSSQNLSPSSLAKLANNDATVGTSGQLLNIESNATFAGQVLVHQNLAVAGNLDIGGVLSLTNISVGGTSDLAQTSVSKNLAVAGITNLQGAVTIASSLQVSGSGNFSGPVTAPQITTTSLQINGELQLSHHITTNGSTPTSSGGSALGGGGTSSISGNDVAGSISINTGGSPPAGCFVSVKFASAYATTPHILLTPVGSAAGGLSYYINPSPSGFSVCDATSPPSGSTFGFDYFVID